MAGRTVLVLGSPPCSVVLSLCSAREIFHISNGVYSRWPPATHRKIRLSYHAVVRSCFQIGAIPSCGKYGSVAGNALPFVACCGHTNRTTYLYTTLPCSNL